METVVEASISDMLKDHHLSIFLYTAPDEPDYILMIDLTMNNYFFSKLFF
uniref:Uncharacterized protein n=1 Tax=Arundo donax TaxID=35708 RepID=A0A0A9H4F6_ARUDO